MRYTTFQITLLFATFFLAYNLNAQSTYKDTIIVLEQVEVSKKLKKPKIKKVVYGKKTNSYHIRHIVPHYYLVDSFPMGKVLEISLNAFNQEKYKGRIAKNQVYCEKKSEHPVNIYEVVENNGVISLGKLLFTDTYLLPPDNAKVKYKIKIDLSDLEIHTDRLLIELSNTVHFTVSPSDNCHISTLGFNTFQNPEGIYYIFDNEGNFIEKKGFSIEMDLKVFTRDY